MPYESFDVGVIVEESPPVSAWAETSYTPVAILSGAPETPPWTKLGRGASGQQFFAGVATVEMFTGDTSLLRDNIVNGDPRIWVTLRPAGGDPPWRLAAATVDPTMGEAAQDNPGDVVTALPMPPDIFARVAAFIDAHHVEQPFYKRRRDEFDESATGDPAPDRKERRR